MYVAGEGIRKEPARTWRIICNYLIIMHILITVISTHVHLRCTNVKENNHPLVTITTEARIPRHIIVSPTKQKIYAL